MKLYQRIAGCLPLSDTDEERCAKQIEIIEELTSRFDTGSGFDGKAELILDESHKNKLVFIIPYHHMDEAGYYDGWSKLKVVVTPDLAFGTSIKITGIMRKYRERGDGDYFIECIDNILTADV